MMNINSSNERKWSHTQKARSRWYTAGPIIDSDYADILTFLANTLAQAECLLHNVKQVARGSGLYMNSDKTEYTCFRNMHG